ncbi:hypothetical protein NDU88_004202 [Pleurodeles waltl]|uniref:Uncharacterized protein n=1 Tax=Pleurodeles waltl TaxID=8319 RepID=A0AAV7SI57_PLEWA|nr:hypothetical protein NDU88_004202 [Pleurodeles waltl]
MLRRARGGLTRAERRETPLPRSEVRRPETFSGPRSGCDGVLGCEEGLSLVAAWAPRWRDRRFGGSHWAPWAM